MTIKAGSSDRNFPFSYYRSLNVSLLELIPPEVIKISGRYICCGRVLFMAIVILQIYIFSIRGMKRKLFVISNTYFYFSIFDYIIYTYNPEFKLH